MLQLCDASRLTDGNGQVLDKNGLQQRVTLMAQAMSALPPQTPIALAGDNSPAWIVADLAAAMSGRAIVPVPEFFTPQQRMHVCIQAGIQTVIKDGQILPAGLVWPDIGVAATDGAVPLPPETQKITFTSGTTGQPKGICLTWAQQMLTADSLFERLSALQIRVHLNLLPLAVLLENIAGVLAPLRMGATVVTPPLEKVGLRGSSDFDPFVCLQAIAQYRAQSIILLPQMLQALVLAVHAKPALAIGLGSLKFVAVGGAPVTPALLHAARSIGIPVYEGYGLTECASVVCLNVPDADYPATVGTPLPGLQVGIDDSGEVWVQGRSYAGVLGCPVEDGKASASSEVCSRIMTGDLGQWVEHGGQRYLRIIGRRKNILITSFGRNVSPEWPERLLMESGLLRQVVVVGDGLPSLGAVLVGARPLNDVQVQLLVKQVNEQLPDYARIARWHVSAEPFTDANGLATSNGRPLRSRIAAQFAHAFSD